MSVRVVARVRPPTKVETERDNILVIDSNGDGADPTVVKMPNPKNEAELYSFQFNSVYDQYATQQQIFEKEGIQDLLSDAPVAADHDHSFTHGQAPLYLLAILQRPTRSSGCASEGGSEVHEANLLAHATRRATARDVLLRAMH